jgi:hypothetical protein
LRRSPDEPIRDHHEQRFATAMTDDSRSLTSASRPE